MAAYAMLGLAVVTLAALSFVTAPYGRYVRDGWGPTVPSRIGWIAGASPPRMVPADIPRLSSAPKSAPAVHPLTDGVSTRRRLEFRPETASRCTR
jgi:hypothetical protein